MDNRAYRRRRGTHKPFTTTPEQAIAEWERLYPEAVARAREKALRPKTTRWTKIVLNDDED